MPESDNSLVAKRLRYIERQRALRAGLPGSFEGRAPEGTGPANRDGMPKLPTGQRQVTNWPVLKPGFWEERGYSDSAEPWFDDRYS